MTPPLFHASRDTTGHACHLCIITITSATAIPIPMTIRSQIYSKMDPMRRKDGVLTHVDQRCYVRYALRRRAWGTCQGQFGDSPTSAGRSGAGVILAVEQAANSTSAAIEHIGIDHCGPHIFCG